MGEKLQFTELDQYLFGQGTIMMFTESLAHILRSKGKKKVFILLYGHLMRRLFL